MPMENSYPYGFLWMYVPVDNSSDLLVVTWGNLAWPVCSDSYPPVSPPTRCSAGIISEVPWAEYSDLTLKNVIQNVSDFHPTWHKLNIISSVGD